MRLYIVFMDFETAVQKLNDVLVKYYRDMAQLEKGVWDFDPLGGFKIVATNENNEFTVHCNIDLDDNDILTVKAYVKPLPDLKDEDLWYALRYITDWLVFTPMAQKTHPYHIDPNDCHKFITKRI